MTLEDILALEYHIGFSDGFREGYYRCKREQKEKEKAKKKRGCRKNG